MKYSDLIFVLKHYDPEEQNGKPKYILQKNDSTTLIFFQILGMATIFHIKIYGINLMLFSVHFLILLLQKVYLRKHFCNKVTN